jgi:hypothetical protein
VTKELMIYFAANPNARLSTSDIADRYHAERQHIARNLKPQITAGYLVIAEPGGSNRPAIYAAGPRLLKART